MQPVRQTWSFASRHGTSLPSIQMKPSRSSKGSNAMKSSWTDRFHRLKKLDQLGPKQRNHVNNADILACGGLLCDESIDLKYVRWTSAEWPIRTVPGRRTGSEARSRRRRCKAIPSARRSHVARLTI